MTQHTPVDTLSVERPVSPVSPVSPASKELLTPAPALFLRARRLWARTATAARYERLDGSLGVARIEIERRIDPHADRRASAGIDESPCAYGWKNAARVLLDESRSALDNGLIDEGWKLLHAARRMEILGYSRDEAKTAILSLREEASKLKAWRREAVHAIIGKDANDRDALEHLPLASLVLATAIRDDHYDNQGYKSVLAGTQVLFLAALLAVVMGGLMALSYFGKLPFDGAELATNFFTLVAVMLFGNLGGTISAIVRASGTNASSSIAEVSSANRTSLIRILLGGASAIAIYLVLRSGFAGLFPEKLASAAPFTVYAVAVASGFTERFVLNALRGLLGDKDDASAKAKSEG